MPNKFLGQHFLKNRLIAQEIVRALHPERHDVIFEIGPGHGELTGPLSEACEKNDAKIFAIEKDQRLVEQLAEKFKTGGIEIVGDDALRFFKTKFARMVPLDRSYKITGNIPYYLTGHLLRTISELEPRPVLCVFMVQKEVAERIVAQPPKMNRLAASIQFWAEPKIIGVVAKENFRPVPKVNSAIVSLNSIADAEREKEIATNRYQVAVQTLFAQPRKTILNNLTLRLKDREKVASLIKKNGLDPGCRPQNLTIKDIILVAKALF